MSGRLRITADPARVSMAASIRAAAEAAPLLVLTGRALGDLGVELGGPGAAAGWLAERAQEVGRPIGVNVPTGDGTSSTAFLAPQTWSRERLQGWVAGRSAELEAAFGEVVRIGSEFPAPGGGT
jgi:hypothetical protein